MLIIVITLSDADLCSYPHHKPYIILFSSQYDISRDSASEFESWSAQKWKLNSIKWWFINHYFISPIGAVLSILIDFHAAFYPLKVMRSLNYLGDVKFIASALSLSKRGRHPGLPTKFRWRNIKVNRKKKAPPRESNSNALHDLELTASLSSSRNPSRHLS